MFQSHCLGFVYTNLPSKPAVHCQCHRNFSVRPPRATPPLFNIVDLHASIASGESTPPEGILKGVNLSMNAGEVHAIMGPNGCGKSTLANVLSGSPRYKVTKGHVDMDGADLLSMSMEERARCGLFLGYQHPVELPGVNSLDFLRIVTNQRREHIGLPPLDPISFREHIQSAISTVKFDPSFLGRAVNEGFSGGERKRHEILQMLLLEPRVAILDEPDSGLDVDALRDVAKSLESLRSPDRAIVIITHYNRILKEFVPDVVHVMRDGAIVESGPAALATHVESSGYDVAS
eukprot:Rmarinus@m.23747